MNTDTSKATPAPDAALQSAIDVLNKLANCAAVVINQRGQSVTRFQIIDARDALARRLAASAPVELGPLTNEGTNTPPVESWEERYIGPGIPEDAPERQWKPSQTTRETRDAPYIRTMYEFRPAPPAGVVEDGFTGDAGPVTEADFIDIATPAARQGGEADRYSVDYHGDAWQNDAGEWVKASDHASVVADMQIALRLQHRRLDELAAALSARQGGEAFDTWWKSLARQSGESPETMSDRELAQFAWDAAHTPQEGAE